MNYLKIFWHMVAIDLKIYKNYAIARIINCLIWAASFIIISSYVLPKFGTQSSYGIVIAAGLVAGAGIFELFLGAVHFVDDLDGDKTINFYLALPIPTWIVFARMALTYAICGMSQALTIIPLMKLLLWHQFDLHAVSWFKFILIFVINFIFYGIFSIFIASLIGNIKQISNAWMRIVFPLFVFGGFQFTWYKFYSVMPNAALINLLNPFIYGTEGIRAALLGQQGYIDYWYCIGALIILSVIFFDIMLRRMKKRLDYV